MLHPLTEFAMQCATKLNTDEASRLAFSLEEIELTQDQADHVLPIMESYGGILASIRAEIAEAESKKPADPDAVYS